MNDRNIKIMELLSVNRKLKISLLAELLDVSQVTLRKDLDYLENCGIICRTHGFACLDGADDTGKRMAFDYIVKRRIARAAVQIVEEGETILLESGSCCTLFADELAKAEKNVTIITNSVFLMNYLNKFHNIKIILLGGYLLPSKQVLVGPMTIKSAEIFYTDKYFLGTDGFVYDYGFTGSDLMQIETVVELTKRAKKVFVITESAKFKRRGLYNMIPHDKLTGVFTDENIPKEAEIVLNRNNIQLYKVPVTEEKLKRFKFSDLPPIHYIVKVN